MNPSVEKALADEARTDESKRQLRDAVERGDQALISRLLSSDMGLPLGESDS